MSSCDANPFNCTSQSPISPIYYGPTPANMEAAAQLFCSRFAAANYSGSDQCPCDGTACSSVNTCNFQGLANGGLGFSQPSGLTFLVAQDTRNGATTVSGTYQSPACICPNGAGGTADGGCACRSGLVWNGTNCVSPAECPVGSGEILGVCTANSVKNLGRPSACVGSSCDSGTGVKYQEEVIFRTPTLNLILSYNSAPTRLLPVQPEPFGKAWSFSYGMRVWLSFQDKAGVLRPDGKILQFLPPSSGNAYIAEAGIADKLKRLVDASNNLTGWKFASADGRVVEMYDAAGNLASITNRKRQTTTLVYSDASTRASIARKPGLLIQVSDHMGRRLRFVYDAESRVIQMADPGGGQYNFFYDESTAFVTSGQAPARNLTSVEFPELHKRVYHYNEQSNTSNTNLANALTGITDESGRRFATYQYDSQGRAIVTRSAGDANQLSRSRTSRTGRARLPMR